jgi:hypothetical protein
MDNDSFSEVSNTSWFSRIGDSIKGIFFGIIVVFISIILLFWNEGRAIKRAKTLEEGQSEVVSVSSDKVVSKNEGKFVHLYGKVKTSDKISDPDFGITENALGLKRNVSMYQWTESSTSKSEKQLGGGKKTTKTYNYTKKWMKRPVDSARFKKPSGHQNPGSFPVSQFSTTAPNATLGAFKLNKGQIAGVASYRSYRLESIQGVKGSLKSRAKLNGGSVYVGADPMQPQIGDMKITFKMAPPSGDATVMAKQVGNSFEVYRTSSGNSLSFAKPGIHSADGIIGTEVSKNNMLTWILRGVGFFLMLIGFSNILGPLSVVADIIPFIGSLVGMATGLISFLVSACLSSVVIALGWVAYRPVIGLSLLAVATACAGAIYAFRKKKSEMPQATKPDDEMKVA